MEAVLAIVLENIMKHNMVGALEVGSGGGAVVGSGDGVLFGNATDTQTLLAARSLWRLIVQRTVVESVSSEVVKRKLLPISIHTLCTLVLAALKLYA
jgi:hypothetical protein